MSFSKDNEKTVYERYLDRCRDDYQLDLTLSFDMPAGYENANGTFDVTSGTVFINAERLRDAPDYEKAFYLFHEFRHALQHLRPDLFDSAIRRSIQYVITYDGTCYKMIDNEYRECKLEGGEEYFTDLYLGQPHEVDANTFAYEKVREIFGDFEDLSRLYEFWMPRRPVAKGSYDAVFAGIDELVND